MDDCRIKYLDPQNDLAFRRIFGRHTKIMKSFLLDILPLDGGRTFGISAMLPEIPEIKHSVVDLSCTDNHLRQFLV